MTLFRRGAVPARQQVVGDPFLGEELLLAFHSTDDPACLTEILRLFATAAMAVPAVAPEENQNARTTAVGLGPGLMARHTLERLGFILESSLEEKLLTRVSAAPDSEH